ncbi:helix-turn-helix domain-containing protein [Bdellovibrio sp. HCB2-146]|uniref:helix-turn-helix domain-containing protein n=1 Tax=Bdellovibrio sp. HCB2-146 TaxID=3394362 RepID=UPI0039BD36CA
MKKTGEILKKAREEKGLSLNEIGLSLKISSKVLKAIEDGDEKQLPAKTFLRGFVQSYANYLHLDTDKILETFYEEMGSTRPKPYIRADGTPTPESLPTEGAEASAPATVTPLPTKPAPRKTDNLAPLQQGRNTKAIAAVILGAVLVGLIIFTKKMIDKYSKEAEVPTAEVEQTMEGATPVSPTSESEGEATATESAPQTSATEAKTSEAPMSAPMTSASPTSTPAPASSPSPAVTPAASATPKVSPSPSAIPSPSPSVAATTTPSPTPTPKPSPSTSPSAKPEEGKPVELIVEALDNVEIEYSSPSGKPQKIKLSAEQVHTFKSKSGLKINFSNGGAVNLILNGKELGIPGDLGKPIKLSY